MSRRKSISPVAPERHDPQRIKAICAWFDRNARELPWRRRQNRNGYTALVAEAMLQQTQVSRVIDPFKAFMKRFPNVSRLAHASEQDVLVMWRGLGYYRRARHLHAAARMIMTEFAGRVPSNASELQTLPGVGRYTAGAIASIVFGASEPIVDGNVQRVLSRWFARRGFGNARDHHNWTWKKAESLVNLAERPGVFNEALMELGATLCAPKSPSCDQCPVATLCAARLQERENQIPKAHQKVRRPAAHHHAVIISRDHGRQVLLQQRSEHGMWSMMWQTPTIEHSRPMSFIEIKQALAISISDLCKADAFVHNTTHRQITFHVYRARTRTRRGIWRSIDSIDGLPMSNAQRRVLKAITNESTDPSRAKPRAAIRRK